MSKKAKIFKTALFLSIVFMAIGFLLPDFCFAQQVTEGLEEVGEAAGIETEEELPVIIGRIIQVVLGFMGIVLLIIVIYAGFLWMTAGGNPEKVEKAKKWLTNGVIGLVIMLFAFSIVTYIVNVLTGEEGIQQAPSYYSGYGTGGSGFGGGALGNGVVEDHYPPRKGTNIPRNTFIMVKFFEPLKKETVMNNAQPCEGNEEQWCGDINETNIQIYETEQADPDTGQPPQDALITEGDMTLTADKKIFFFKPAEYLGSSEVDVYHTVFLNSGLQNEDEENIFGEYGNYGWVFKTGTFIDETPPQVVSVYPEAPEDNPDFQFFANSIIQINFNEPVLPPPDSKTDGNQSDETKSIYIPFTQDGETEYVVGAFNVGLNQFRTIEFMPDKVCAEGVTNSCGEIPRCLPKGATISPYIKSAGVNEIGQTSFPFDGIVDAAGNSLDGNENGESEGPAEDDVSWTFQTSTTLDLTPPVIEDVQPNNSEGEVDLDAPVLADFSEGLSAAYANSANVFLKGDDWNKWFTVHFFNEPGEPDENGQTTTVTNNSVMEISHGDFEKAPEPAEGETVIPYKYYPIITDRIRDLRQNCFYPCAGPGCSDPGPSCCEGDSSEQASCGILK